MGDYKKTIYSENVTPVLSIIVPVYNVEKYLNCCLMSLLYQNVHENVFEVICIDDGSTDGSGGVLDEFANKHNNLKVVHQQNCGVSSARNKGIELVKGEYIWFVDADDLIAENSLKSIIDCINENKKPDMLSVGVISFDDNDRSISELKGKALSIDEESKRYSEWIFAEIVKADIIRNNGIRFDSNVFYGEDDIFQVFLHQYIITKAKLNRVVYFYRQRLGSALHSSISEDNIERIMKTYNSDLKYAETYTFFDYKRKNVYKGMPYLMLYITQQPHKIAKRYISMLKGYKLFPLNSVEGYVDNKKMTRSQLIRRNSYRSYVGYYILRLYTRLYKGIKK